MTGGDGCFPLAHRFHLSAQQQRQQRVGGLLAYGGGALFVGQ